MRASSFKENGDRQWDVAHEGRIKVSEANGGHVTAHDGKTRTSVQAAAGVAQGTWQGCAGSGEAVKQLVATAASAGSQRRFDRELSASSCAWFAASERIFEGVRRHRSTTMESYVGAKERILLLAHTVSVGPCRHSEHVTI